MSTTDSIMDLGRRWARAEVNGDTAELAGLSADEFHLVGPVGFVLDRSQWLDRYGATRMLELTELRWEDVSVRDYGDTAIAIGTQSQRGTFAGNPADGRFRVTQVAVREHGDWKLASLHYSPIGGPSPFGGPGAAR